MPDYVNPPLIATFILAAIVVGVTVLAGAGRRS